MLLCLRDEFPIPQLKRRDGELGELHLTVPFRCRIFGNCSMISWNEAIQRREQPPLT